MGVSLMKNGQPIVVSLQMDSDTHGVLLDSDGRDIQRFIVKDGVVFRFL